MEKPQTKAVSIVPKAVFGLRTDVLGNIHFDNEKTVIYPVAGVLAFMDVETKKQRFLRFAENSQPTIIAISPSRKYLAIAEKMTEKTVTNIYEISTFKRKKSLILSGCPVNEPSAIAFTHDSKNIAILSKEPDAFLSVFALDKDEVFMGRASNSAMPGRARCISCNPGDNAITAVGGEFLLKLMNKTEKGFGQIGTVKGDNIKITSISWLSQDVLIAGTNESEILFVEGGDPKAKYSAIDTDLIDLTKIPEGEEMVSPSQEELYTKDNIDVRCITNFTRGFVYALHNIVHVYEKEGAFKFIKKTIITLPITIYENPSYCIVNMAVNMAEDTVIATAVHAQIYIAELYKPESLKVEKMEFKTLGEPLHIDSIIACSICAWKSIIMTASKDLTVRIWNYKTMKIELVKQYQLNISVMTLHPSGMFAIIGFSDSLRFMQIQLDTLKMTKTFSFPSVNVVEFSNRGHLLAVAHGKLAMIVCIFTFETLHVLSGHNGEIMGLVWASNDSKLVSSGSEGAIYEWDSLTGKRVNEIVQKGAEYRCLALSSDGTSIFAITSGGVLREIVKSDVIREFNTPDASLVNCVAMARSDMFMFIGTDGGCLYNVQCPLGESGGGTFTNYRFFHKSVNKVKITYDDKLLVTVSDDGTLVIWTLLNIAGKTAEIDSVLGTCTDIMTNRIEILSKIDMIKALELRMNQQVEEFEYKIRHGDVFHSEQMRDIHKSYCDIIEEMRQKFDDLKLMHAEQRIALEMEIQKMENDHQKQVMDMESDFSEKIINEYEKVSILRKRMEEMKEDYELKLRKSAGHLQDTIIEMEKSWSGQLKERQALINHQLRAMDELRKEFNEYLKQVEIDNDRNIVETQLNYEKRLKEESECCVKWRGEAGVLEQKMAACSEKAIEVDKQNKVLLQQQERSRQTIQEMNLEILNLKESILERDFMIQEKDKKCADTNKANVELEKFKSVMQSKIFELKSLIEPLEVELRKKKDHIVDIEKELNGIHKNYRDLELKMDELKFRYSGTVAELKREIQKRRKADTKYNQVCGEIHQVKEFILNPEKLKLAVIELFRKYANTREVKDTLYSDTHVQAEFLRHREHLEKMSAASKVTEEKKENRGMDQMLKENMFLIGELNKQKEGFDKLKAENTKMRSILGLTERYVSLEEGRVKLEKASMTAEAIEAKYKDRISTLENQLRILQDEAVTLKAQLLND